MTESEHVIHSNENVTAITEYLLFNKELSDPTRRRQYFENLDEDDFIDEIQRVASLVRTGDSNHLQHFDGEAVQLMMLEVPDQREKEGLLRESWNVAHDFLKDNSFSDEEALLLTGITVAGAIIYTHPFIDGNGRTSRVLAYEIMRGYNTGDNLTAILAEESGGSEWYMSPLNNHTMREWDKRFVTSSQTPHGFNGKASILSHDASSQVLAKFLEDVDTTTYQLLEPAKKYDENGNLSIDVESAFALLEGSSEPLLYMRKLAACERLRRAEHTRSFLRVMRQTMPDEALYLRGTFIDPDHEMFTPTYAAESKLLAERSKQLFGQYAVNGLIVPRHEMIALHKAYSDVYHR